MSAPRIAIVLSGFPRRSETFALADIAALQAHGLVAAVFSTKDGEPGVPQPDASRLRSRVHRLCGDPSAQAAAAAGCLREQRVTGIHAYFAHAPADVAVALARILGVPFGFSLHARDARKISREALHERARRAKCVVACNPDVARELDGSGVPVQVVPHGVDLERFRPGDSEAGPELQLLAVGRLVEKKGFDVLFDALAVVTVPWRLRIVGEGPECERLAQSARTIGIADRVVFVGALTHDALPGEYRRASIVVVPSVPDRTGDRDGLPNVVLEAMACARAIVATNVGAISSAIRNADTGLLVAARDRSALANAITRLGRDARLRATLGRAARTDVERRFDVRDCTNRLASVLREAYA